MTRPPVSKTSHLRKLILISEIGKVDARSASEMLSARDIKLVREILSSSETFQNAVAKREVDEREIPVYIIFTYAE